MGCCGSKKENEVELSSLKEFPPLEENIDQNIICRKYPFDILAPNCLQNPEDIKTYRVVVIGDKKVGKSQIIDRVMNTKTSTNKLFRRDKHQKTKKKKKIGVTQNLIK